MENEIPDNKVRKQMARGVSKKRAKKLVFGQRKKKGKRRK